MKCLLIIRFGAKGNVSSYYVQHYHITEFNDDFLARAAGTVAKENLWRCLLQPKNIEHNLPIRWSSHLNLLLLLVEVSISYDKLQKKHQDQFPIKNVRE